MEEVTKRLHKQLRSSTSKKIRDSDAFRGVDQDIKNFLNTCPLIMALTHKCMRPRHWEMLMKTTGVEFTPPHKDRVCALSSLCACVCVPTGPAMCSASSARWLSKRAGAVQRPPPPSLAPSRCEGSVPFSFAGCVLLFVYVLYVFLPAGPCLYRTWSWVPCWS